MGYTHNTNMAKFIPANACAFSAGTWTPSVASNVPVLTRAAADVDNTIIIPLSVPSNGAYRAGSKIASVDIYYTNATADMTAVTIKAHKVTLTADAAAVTGAEITAITIDHVAADRITQASHTINVKFDVPPWIDDAEAYYLSVLLDTGAAAVFTFKGARINYTERR